jgi:pyruvate/2-oxoglutarate dehydrogenase complex dihydrolipoamide dehydrogenase (E3) component
MAGPVVVLGGGSTGEAFVGAFRRLHPEDPPLTVIEEGLVGGECSYYACMPSKTLLRPTELVAAARLAPGAAEAVSGLIDATRVFWWRDQVTSGWDDSGQARWLADRKAELVRGRGAVVRPGVVAVDGRELPYEHLVVATGSSSAIPPVPGLDSVPYWTSREATSSHEVPESLAVLGGGVVACELAQAYARLGSKVTIVHRSSLLRRVDEEAGEILHDVFRDERIDVRLGASVSGVSAGGGRVVIELEDGSAVGAAKLLVATGRVPNAQGLGLELVGCKLEPKGIEVDERLRAADGVWAVGDVNGIALFTHAGKYQARIAAANVAGQPTAADHRAVPGTTFTDPQVASVGTTRGDNLVSASWRVDRTSRASTYERPKRRGFLRLVADPDRRVIVGAVAVGPEAGEWLGQVTLAIRAEVSVDVLRDTIQPYPTFSEAIFFAARDLPV